MECARNGAAHTPSVSGPERFTKPRWLRVSFAPSVRRMMKNAATLQRSILVPVLWPESFRGGCSFGAASRANGGADSSGIKCAQGRLMFDLFKQAECKLVRTQAAWCNFLESCGVCTQLEKVDHAPRETPAVPGRSSKFFERSRSRQVFHFRAGSLLGWMPPARLLLLRGNPAAKVVQLVDYQHFVSQCTQRGHQ